ncbi:MAG: hypothetical protein M3Y77_15985, partial [Actinomycetota bacterium]|nr:hypothetical protein [Actinomycetota bacterium]
MTIDDGPGGADRIEAPSGGDPRIGPASSERSTGDAGLADSLAALSTLSSGLGLVQLLTRVAHYAVQAIPGADGAG